MKDGSGGGARRFFFPDKILKQEKERFSDKGILWLLGQI